jgi:hypothetical protein
MDPVTKPLHEIRFDYLPASPLANGWRALSAEEKAQFDFATDIRDGLSMKADPDKFGMDYVIPETARAAHLIQFEAVFGFGGRFYAHVLVNKPAGSGTEEWWLKHVAGDPAHNPTKLPGQEWRFYVAPLNDRKQYRLDLREDIRRALPPGTTLVKVQELRLRGNISLSPIRLSDAPLEFESRRRWRLSGPWKTWPRTDKLTLLAIVIAIVIGISAFFVPEVRTWLGLEKAKKEIPGGPPPGPQAREPSPLIAETATSVREMRKVHRVSAISEVESEKTTAEVPPDSFGFAYGIGLTYDNPLALANDGSLRSFEIHKIHDGSVVVLAFVGQETFLKLREGARSGEQIVLLSNPFKEYVRLVAIPRNRIHCSRARNIDKVEGVDCKVTD